MATDMIIDLAKDIGCHCMLRMLALRNICTYIVNQQTHTVKICFNIY